MLKKLFQTIKKAITGGVVYFLLGTVIVKCIALVSNVLIGRFLSVSEYAHLSYVDNIYQYLLIFSGMSMSSVILKVCSQTDDPKICSDRFKYSFKVGLLLQSCGVLLVVVVFTFIKPPFTGLVPLFLSMAAYPVCFCVLEMVQAYIRVHLYNKTYFFFSVASAAIILGIILATNSKMGAYGVALARICGYGIIALLCTLFLKNRKKIKRGSCELRKSEKKDVWFTGLSICISTMLSTLMPVNDMLLVNNIIADENTVANFRIATMFPFMMLMITNSILAYSYPIFAKNAIKRRIVWDGICKISIINAVIIIVIAVIGYLSSPMILDMLYNGKYDDALNMMRLFWILYGFNCIARAVPMNIMPMIGLAGISAKFTSVCFVFHFVADYVLISNFGIKGLFFSLSVIYFGTAVIFWIIIYRDLVYREK